MMTHRSGRSGATSAISASWGTATAGRKRSPKTMRKARLMLAGGHQTLILGATSKGIASRQPTNHNSQ